MPQTSSTSQSKVDINNIVTDLNGKADKDLNNLSTAGLAVLNEKADIDLSNLSTTGKSKLGGSSRNLGEIVSSTLPLTDAGLHLLDGSLIQGGGIYDKFVQYIANLDLSANYFCTETEWQQSITDHGVCGKFVYDSTNNTVRLPKITGIVEGTTDVSALGDLVEAGLPDHNHSFTRPKGDQSYSNGSGNVWWGTSAITVNTTHASASNSIYGNSATVQPQTIKAFYYIVIATSTKTDVQVDIDNIATDLNGKADVGLSNITDSAKVQMAKSSMPDGIHYIDVTIGASGATYISPVDGWVRVAGTATADFQYVKIFGNSSNGVYIPAIQSTAGKNQYPGCYIPIKKGQEFQVEYTTTEVNPLRFFYAVGSESETS